MRRQFLSVERRCGPLGWVGAWLFLLAGCDRWGDEHEVRRAAAPTETTPRVIASSTVGAGSTAGCSSERCSPYRCDPRFDRCRTECGSSDDCGDGYLCEGGFCVGTECTEETAAARCAGYACVRGHCAADCVIGPCGDGFYCRGDTNECVRQCVTRADPICQGYVCDLEVGECESYCFDTELECAQGFVCGAADECEPIADAGARDAG